MKKRKEKKRKEKENTSQESDWVTFLCEGRGGVRW
jgi:hypothetical protein